MKEIVARLDALNDLLKDLLFFARPPQPRSPRGPAHVAYDGRSLGADPALGLHIEIVGDDAQVMADADLLKIIVQNLFINAAQAMQGQGAVRVSLEPLNGKCRVTSSDTGPGIPHEVRERMFRPFFTTKARGTGLGLSTAKRLVEAHAGSIGVDCPPGGGTTVEVRLPMLP